VRPSGVTIRLVRPALKYKCRSRPYSSWYGGGRHHAGLASGHRDDPMAVGRRSPSRPPRQRKRDAAQRRCTAGQPGYAHRLWLQVLSSVPHVIGLVASERALNGHLGRIIGTGPAQREIVGCPDPQVATGATDERKCVRLRNDPIES
jgi:hypothetical protein